MSFDGMWRIVSSPDFDNAYLAAETQPFVRLAQQGKRITGEYHVGYQSGGLNGKMQSDTQALFSFEGNDEMEEVNGRGTLTLHGDKLTLVLEYYQADTYTFEAVREPEEEE